MEKKYSKLLNRIYFSLILIPILLLAGHLTGYMAIGIILAVLLALVAVTRFLCFRCSVINQKP